MDDFVNQRSRIGRIAIESWFFRFIHSTSPPHPYGQMGIFLSQGEELRLARELCDYGKRLSPRFQSPGEPPFENQYQDYAIYLAALDGEAVEQAIDHFQAKAAVNALELKHLLGGKKVPAPETLVKHYPELREISETEDVGGNYSLLA